MRTEAPTWVMYVFAIVNASISIAYGLLAFYFIKRIKLPNKTERNPLTLIACVGAGVFFIGCAHTHIDLAFWAVSDELRDHWYSWWNVTSHALQAIGGITFWFLATFYLQLNIFDKKHYQKITGGEDNV